MRKAAQNITDTLVPLLMALGGLICARYGAALAERQDANLWWQIGFGIGAYLISVALLGLLGHGDPYDAIASATSALLGLTHTVLGASFHILLAVAATTLWILSVASPAPATV
ncbi:hypothetical protein AB0M58_14010 [Streptomyces bobili]|uniref:hypothetical protein n=1 Tax=Streptomyces bobili TaxID=67280 RepID=UPI003432903F